MLSLGLKVLIIKHRINSIKELKTTPIDFGVEIDVRSDKKELILSHDPFKPGDKLKDWLKSFKHKFIIFNIKEEGIEVELFRLIKEYNIKNFFLLDQSFSFYIKTLNIYGKYSSNRISDYENLARVLILREHTKWVWVDYFKSFPLKITDIKKLKKLKFRLCIVSPELLNHSNVDTKIELIKGIFNQAKEKIDMICTKNEKLWT